MPVPAPRAAPHAAVAGLATTTGMLSETQIKDLATKLNEAERGRQSIRQFSLDHPEITVEDAYAVQRTWVDLKLAEGRTVTGHKIGLTSRSMQRFSNLTEPDYGILFNDMVFDDGAQIPSDRFIEPRVEVELAFLLDRPLRGPGVTLFDVLDATGYVRPAIEIIDARVQRTDPETKETRKIYDTIADNAAAAGLVVGGRPVKALDVDLRWVSALLYRGGMLEESGVAAAVLNHPANGVAWLANKLAPHGTGLEAGHLILAGSFTSPVSARPGDVFHIDYHDLGSIACSFT